jgi:hypothetical protein
MQVSSYNLQNCKGEGMPQTRALLPAEAQLVYAAELLELLLLLLLLLLP